MRKCIGKQREGKELRVRMLCGSVKKMPLWRGRYENEEGAVLQADFSILFVLGHVESVVPGF